MHKRIVNIIGYTVASIAAFLVLTHVLMLLPTSQTMLANKIATIIGEHINGKIHIGKAHFRPINTLLLRDVYILDDSPYQPKIKGENLPEKQDTLFKAEYIIASFSAKGLLGKEKNGAIRLRHAKIENGLFAFVIEPKTTNLKRIFNLGGNNKQKKKKSGEIFKVGKVEINNFEYRMINFSKPQDQKEFGIKWGDMDVTNINLKGRNLKMEDGIMSGIGDQLSFKEKSGFICDKMSGEAKVGNGATIIKDLKIKSGRSDIFLPTYKMLYENTAAFSDFTNKVRLEGQIQNSTVDFESISYFAPGLKGNKLLVTGNGTVKGPINNMYVKDFNFVEHLTETTGNVSCHLSSVTTVRKMRTDFNAKQLTFNSSGLGKFIAQWTKKDEIPIFKKLAKERVFTFKGEGEGKLDSLKVKGIITNKNKYNPYSYGGIVAADIKFADLLNNEKPIKIAGNISSNELELGKILNSKELGKCTLDATLSTEFSKKGPNIDINGLTIKKLGFHNYDYKNIIAKGNYSHEEFDGRIISGDDNLNFMFQGIFSLSDKTKNGRYVFYANIGRADFQKLNIDKRGPSVASMIINADFTRLGLNSDKTKTNTRGELIGNIDIKEINLKNKFGQKKVGNIYIGSHSNNDIHRINFKSQFADATFVGNKSITSLPNKILNLVLRKELSAINGPQKNNFEGKYDVDINFYDSRNILAFILPGLYIANGSKFNLNITENDKLNVDFLSDRVAYNNDFLKDLNITISNAVNKSLKDSINYISANLTSKIAKIKTLTLNNNNFNIKADNNEINLDYIFDKGKINASSILTNEENITPKIYARIFNSYFYAGKEKWNLSTSGIYHDALITEINNLILSCKDQSVKINGGISKTQKDTLELKLSNFDMSIIDSFLKKECQFEGLASGRALLISQISDKPGILANLNWKDAKMGGYDAGEINVASAWNENIKGFDIILKSNLNGKNNISARASYMPNSNNLSSNITLDGMQLGYFSPFLKSIFKQFEGELYGDISVNGPLNNLSTSGNNTKIEKGLLHLDFTNVPYYLNGPFSITDDGIFFNNISISDRFGGSGTANGGIRYNKLKNFAMDTQLLLNNIEGMNTELKDNDNFYGSLFASGKLSLLGPFNALQIDADLVTGKNGTFVIPLNNGMGSGKSNLLTFKEEDTQTSIDPYEEMLLKKAKKASSNNLKIKLNIGATPDVKTTIEFDKSTGNMLSARGSGQISLDIQPSSGTFNIGGDYNIASGNYHLSAMGIAERNFAIKEGSKIKFKGDIMDSDLDVEGLYLTKTSLGTLIADTTSISTRRPVECGIEITDKLKNPRLKFSINVPDLDPTTKAMVESALNTEDKIQRQFLSLLISNSFLPEEQSGIVNNTNILYSNVAEIMSNQLNSIFEKLDIPLDLGLTYQSTERGNDIFDVALSTKLFDNRVIVNGTIGNRQYGGTANQRQDMVGDLDIEIKLDKAGRIRLNLFSHSADGYTNYLDNTQRNGAGITYQKEFDGFKQFFKDIFTSKKKRDKRALEKIQQGKKAIKTIQIHRKASKEKNRNEQ